MERLSHDLNLALEESNCDRQERRKVGLRRRTRSAGNLPASVAVSIVEDGSSSSPPQAAVIVTQPLSDSDDIQLHAHKSGSHRSRHYSQIGNIESDSFNENFSPTRPANTRRKRKYKIKPMEYTEGKTSPPIDILNITEEPNVVSSVIAHTPSSESLMGREKMKHRRTTFCGKRKWSHRDKGDVCEMRERSFSGGYSSKSSFLTKNDLKSKRHECERKRKESLLQPGKIVLKSSNSESAQSSNFTSTSTLPGSSSFNFVYKNSSTHGVPILSSKFMGYKVTTNLPPFFNPVTSLGKNSIDFKYYKKSKLNKSYPSGSLRNPLCFDNTNNILDYTGNESSSLSSSDSDGLVTNDSDREGDDELTDWPGIEELKVFNKSLTFKSSKGINNNTPKTISNMPPPKRLKKEKSLVKTGWTTCKNKHKKRSSKEDSENDDEAMMSDSMTVVDVENDTVRKENRDILQPHSSFSSFSDIKNAGVSGQGVNESFFQSFEAFQAKSNDDPANQVPRTNFTLQKTSSSDLNVSERSPVSDHYCSEYSMSNAGVTEVREIRAGCRRIRDERPGFLILSAANEQLSKFLQDSSQHELKLPNLNDPEEREKLESLAKLYSLELRMEMDQPTLSKTINTTQAIRVEHTHHNFPPDHKRRCYGEEIEATISFLSDHNSGKELEESQDMAEVQCRKDSCNINEDLLADTFSQSLVNKSLLHPGEID